MHSRDRARVNSQIGREATKCTWYDRRGEEKLSEDAEISRGWCFKGKREEEGRGGASKWGGLVAAGLHCYVRGATIFFSRSSSATRPASRRATGGSSWLALTSWMYHCYSVFIIHILVFRFWPKAAGNGEVANQ